MTHLLNHQEGLGRDWQRYNKELVERGAFLLSLDWLDSWLSELRFMNAGKVGAQFWYPRSMVEFCAHWHAQGLSYRAVQGLLRALCARLGPFPVIDYSQIRRRVLALDVSFGPLPTGAIVGIDGTGLQISLRGDWRREKWGGTGPRGWVQCTLMGTIDGDIIDVIVQDECGSEVRAARELVNKHAPRRVLMDKGHDNYQTYLTCKQTSTQLVCPVKKNAKKTGLSTRADAAREQALLGYETWKDKYRYGMRWPATEGIFSATKRVLGEGLRSHKKKWLLKEAKNKFWTYQCMRACGAQAV